MGAFLQQQTGGRRGWQTDLVARSGVKRQTISKWTNPAYDGWPELEHLSALASALDLPAWRLVAVLEDEEAPPEDWTDLAGKVDRLSETVDRLVARDLAPGDTPAPTTPVAPAQ